MRLRGIARACSIALLATLVLSSDARAHVRLVRSSPARGDSLRVAPAMLRLEFNEAPELSMSRVQLVDSLQQMIRLLPLRTVGDSSHILIADVAGRLPRGRYSVVWQVAGPDGHPVRGRFDFVVLDAAPGVSAAPAPVVAATKSGSGAVPSQTHREEGFDSESLPYVLIRWAQFVGLLVVIGAVAFRWLVLDRAARGAFDESVVRDAVRRTLHVATLGTVLLALSAGARLVAQWLALRLEAAAPSAMPLERVLTQSTWGHAWLTEVVALVVLGVALVTARRPGRGRTGWTLATLAAIVLAVVPALSGHAAVPRTAVPVILDALHVLAAGGWMGTLLVLLAAGLPATRTLPPPARTPAMAALVDAFTPLALSCAALIVATGLLASLRNVESLTALGGTRYGNMLLRKLFFLAVAVLIGFYNWRRARPALAASGDGAKMRRTMQLELAMGAVILLFTAYLVAIPTPAELVRP